MNLIILMLLIIAAETSYLTYRSISGTKRRVDSASILVDTSVLIDGRIESIARSGLISAGIVIPRSVVRELQYMADKADHEKRERARFGLDMIEKLQNIETISVTIYEDEPLTDGGVDERLVHLAKASGARLCTTDYNLNKAARVQGVTVLNINEIAHALRIVRLPGEQVTIYLQQPGQERDQAVGHLDDGTMVVVDNGKRFIGEAVQVEVTRALQTVAGKMLFAKLVHPPATPKPKVQSTPAPVPKQRSTQPRPAKPQQQPNARPQVQKPQPAPAAGPQKKPRRPKRQSMTDRAEDSLVNLLNKQ